VEVPREFPWIFGVFLVGQGASVGDLHTLFTLKEEEREREDVDPSMAVGLALRSFEKGHPDLLIVERPFL
jgi:hypothetical protein